MVKHIAIVKLETREISRVAVKIVGEHIEIRTLAGPVFGKEIVDIALSHCGLWDKAHELHKNRMLRTAVQVRHGMSGCVDYLLRVERDPELMDFPVVSRLHVSMYGKLNEGFRGWLGNVIPLAIAAGIGSSPVGDAYEWWEEVPFAPEGGWKTAEEWYDNPVAP